MTPSIVVTFRFIVVCMMCTCGSSAAKRPNVLFLVVDDLRPSLGCYDEPIMRTLNVDNLASKSVLFEQAFVQQAICGPSRVSFLTSRRPDTTRLYDFYSYWRVHAGNYTTLPQHFKEHGYITQSVGKVFHPGKASNFSDDSPYSWTNTPYHPPTQQYKMAKVCPNADGTVSMNIVCPVDVQKMPGKSLPDIQSSQFAVDFLKNMSQGGSDQPFFLAVGFHKPHIPLKYPKEFLDLYPLSEIKLAKYHTYPLWMPLVAWNPWTDLRERDDVQKLNISFPFGPVPDHFQLLMRQSYYAATSYMDAQVGKVLAALESNGFSDNTIISFVGDHGWALGEHQEWSKYSVFDVATRVPLLMYIPGVTHTKKYTSEKIFPYFDPLQTKKPSPSHHMKPKHEKKDKTMYFESEVNTVNIGFSETGVSANQIKAQLDSHTEVVQEESFSTFKEGFASSQSYDSSQPGAMFGKAFKSSALVELVDLFPTLAEAAGLATLPLCPDNPFKTMLCTEGASLMPLIRNITGSEKTNTFHGDSKQDNKLSKQSIVEYETEFESHHVTHSLAQKCSPEFKLTVQSSDEMQWKKAAFSQYPRPSVEPQEDSDKPHLKNIRIMGYTMWTADFHYTEWVGFIPDNYTIVWDDIYGRELYLRSSDPYEINNMALFERCFPLVSVLSQQLHTGWRAALPK